MKSAWAALAVTFLALGLTACGLGTTAGKQAQAVGTKTAHPSPSAPPNLAWGMGDIKANPDSAYMCAMVEYGPDGSTPMAWLTAAGSNLDSLREGCGTLKNDGVFHLAELLPALHEKASCWITVRGTATYRVYAAPGEDSAAMASVCAAWWQEAGVTS